MGKKAIRLLAAMHESDARIGPDPLTAVLAGLAALGAIASIAAINWVGNEKPEPVPNNRRRVATALRDLEKTVAGLVDVFQRLNRNFRIFVGEGGAISAPMTFGVHGLRIPQHSYPLYQSLLADTTTLLASASQHAFDVMCLIEDGAIEPPEEVFYALGDAQERLSVILRERVSLRLALDEGLDIARGLADVVREIKAYRIV